MRTQPTRVAQLLPTEVMARYSDLASGSRK